MLMGMTEEAMAVGRAASEPHAIQLADAARSRLQATWGVGETGAAGPAGNRYGDPAGHCCVAVAGPVTRAATLATGSEERWENMEGFAAAALGLLAEALDPED